MSRGERKHLVIIISRFSFRCTFIARELQELCRRGYRLSIISLRRTGRRDRDWVARHLPGARLDCPGYLLSPAILRAMVHYGFRRPAMVLRVLATLLTRGYRSPAVLFRTLSVFPKSLAIAKWAEDTDASRIHCHWATVAATSGWIASRINGLPFSFTAHAWDIYTDDTFHALKLMAADCVVVCNAYGRGILLSRNGERFADKVHVNYHGLDTQVFRPAEEGARQGSPIILAVGKLQEKKGFHFLVEACEILRSRGVAFRCLLAGDPGDTARRIEKFIAEKELGDRIELLGLLDPEEMLSLYQTAHILVAPTVVTTEGQTDGLPNVVLEAMACGVPVVATDVAGIPEAVEHGETGLLIPPEDPRAIADAVAGLLREPEARSRLARAARERILNDFDVRHNVGALLQLFSSRKGRHTEPALHR